MIRRRRSVRRIRRNPLPAAHSATRYGSFGPRRAPKAGPGTAGERIRAAAQRMTYKHHLKHPRSTSRGTIRRIRRAVSRSTPGAAKRRLAALKAARTRKRNARYTTPRRRKSASRSAAARKGARTRKRNAAARRARRAAPRRRVRRAAARRPGFRRRHVRAIRAYRRGRAVGRGYATRGMRSVVAARRSIKRARAYGPGRVRRYLKVHGMRANALATIKDMFKLILPVGGAYVGSMFLANKVGGLLASKMPVALASYSKTITAAAITAGAHFLGKKVAAGKHYHSLILGAGLNTFITALAELPFLAPVRAFMGADDVYDHALAGYQSDVGMLGTGDYIQTGAEQDLGEYVDTGDYVQTGADEDLGVGPFNEGDQHRQLLLPVSTVAQTAQVPQVSMTAPVPRWSAESELGDLYTGIFARHH